MLRNEICGINRIKNINDKTPNAFNLPLQNSKFLPNKPRGRTGLNRCSMLQSNESSSTLHF